MLYQLEKRGADLTGGVALLVLLLLAMIPMGTPWARLLAAVGLAAAGWGYLRLLTYFARWGIVQGQLWVHIGLLFTTEQHIGLARITAIHLLSTPFSRPLGVCLLLVYSAGAVTLLPCVRQADAEQLILCWQSGRCPENAAPASEYVPGEEAD